MRNTKSLALATILTLLATGCAFVGEGKDRSLGALCERTAGDRTAHAAALAADGGPKSILTGRNLIIKLDAGCDE